MFKAFVPPWFLSLYSNYYDKLHLDPNAGSRSTHATILSNIELGKCKNILEVGCATGILTKGLLLQCNYVTAIDISPNMILIAKSNLKEFEDKLEINCVDILDYNSYKNSKFQIVICNSVLQFTKFPSKVLEKIHSLMEVEGILYLGLPYPKTGKYLLNKLINAICDYSLGGAIINSLILLAWAMRKYSFWTEEETKIQLYYAKFINVEIIAKNAWGFVVTAKIINR